MNYVQKTIYAIGGLSLISMLIVTPVTTQAETRLITAEVTGDKTTSSSNWQQIPDLEIALPPDSSGNLGITLIFNAPNGYAVGSNFPGTEFRIMRRQGYGGSYTEIAYGAYTYDLKQPQSYGRKPITIVRTVNHGDPESPRIRVEWKSVRSATSHLGGSGGMPSATLTAIVAPLGIAR